MDRFLILMENFLNQIYLSPVRSWLRNIGIINLFRFYSEIQTQFQYFEYSLRHPISAKVQADGCVATLLVSSKEEYVRVLSVNRDKHIIKRLVDYIKSGDTCWDIGANIGLYTVLLAKAVGENGTVVAFEPEKNSFKRLIENIKFNKLANVYPLNVALGQENTKMLLRVSDHYASGTHSLVMDKESNHNKDKHENVEVIRGDTFRVQEKKEIPVAIKIDVEGAEEDVLIGLDETLKDKKCRFVVCEVHFSILQSSGRREAPRKIHQFLKDRGFSDQTWLDHSHLIAYKG